MKNIMDQLNSVIDGIVHFIPTVITYLSEKSSLLALVGLAVAIFTLREMVKERRES